VKFIRSKMKRNQSQAILVSGRSDNREGFIAAQSTLVCGFIACDCFVSSQRSVRGSPAPLSTVIYISIEEAKLFPDR
jgi:hypothetical protein